MYRFKSTIILLVMMAFCSRNLPSDTPSAGIEIYRNNKYAVCDITSTAWLKDGKKSVWPGTGFFIDKAGHLLTADHVVRLDEDDERTPNVTRYTYEIVIRANNRKYSAKMIGANRDADTAMLQVEKIRPEEFSTVKIGDPDKLEIGEPVFALGNPRTFSNTLTAGIVSTIHRQLGTLYLEDYIQTDCAINPGNSGSPLFNARGEVVGINQRIVRDTEGLHFASSINIVKIDIMRQGHIEAPSIGFDCLLENFPRSGRPDKSDPEDIKYLMERTGLSEENSLILARDSYVNCAIVVQLSDPRDKITPPPPKTNSNLARGDIIVSLDGRAIRNGMEVRTFLMGKKPGDVIKVQFHRAERGVMVNRETVIKLTPRPSKT